MTRDEIALKIYCAMIEKYGKADLSVVNELIDDFIKLVGERNRKSEYRRLVETIRILSNNESVPPTMRLLSIRTLIQEQKHIWEEL